MEIALQARPTGDYMIICSFACDPEGRLQSGMRVTDAFARCHAVGATIVGTNCLNGPGAMIDLLETIPSGDLFAAYPNAGCPRCTKNGYVYLIGPSDFDKAAVNIAAQGASLIGGCCGTTPAHIAVVARAISGIRPVRMKSVRLANARSRQKRLAAQVEASGSNRILAKTFKPSESCSRRGRKRAWSVDRKSPHEQK
jgi:methionine synthase / methylenetetrahydrofolate reductase(NADPH)